MRRMEKKQLKQERKTKVVYILIILTIFLIIGIYSVDKTLGHMTGNYDLRAIAVNFENDIAIVHFLGNEYDVDYRNLSQEISTRLESLYDNAIDSITSIKDQIIYKNVGE